MIEEMSLSQLERLLAVLDKIYRDKSAFRVWYEALIDTDGKEYFSSIQHLEESLQTWEGVR